MVLKRALDEVVGLQNAMKKRSISHIVKTTYWPIRDIAELTKRCLIAYIMSRQFIALILITIFVVTTQNGQSQTIVARWLYDGTINDSIGAANGTATGVSIGESTINGKTKTVGVFNGTGGIDITTNFNNLKLGNKFAISAWLNVANWNSSGGNNDFTILCAGVPGQWPANPHDAAFAVGFNSDRSDFHINAIDSYPDSSMSATARASKIDNSAQTPTLGIGIGEWHHFAYSFDGTTSTINAYLDGSKLYQYDFSSFGTNLSPYSTFTNVRIGTDLAPVAGSAGPIFYGMMYDLEVYNGTLNDSQILNLFTSIPEPSALSLRAVGLGGLAMMRRRRS